MGAEGPHPWRRPRPPLWQYLLRVAIGADDEDKVELEPACFGRARHIVVDSELTSRCGCLAHALHAGAVTAAAMTGELGELLDSPPEPSNNDITISKHIGVGVEDLAAAQVALTRLGDGTAASD
jgi:ornithine cyclodeaminase/alanine dehydrogenase-like protein (mu-crystallin family)